MFKINQTQLAKKLGVTRQYISSVKKNGVSTNLAKQLELTTGISALEWGLYCLHGISPWKKLKKLNELTDDYVEMSPPKQLKKIDKLAKRNIPSPWEKLKQLED